MNRCHIVLQFGAIFFTEYIFTCASVWAFLFCNFGVQVTWVWSWFCEFWCKTGAMVVGLIVEWEVIGKLTMPTSNNSGATPDLLETTREGELYCCLILVIATIIHLIMANSSIIIHCYIKMFLLIWHLYLPPKEPNLNPKEEACGMCLKWMFPAPTKNWGFFWEHWVYYCV